LNYHILKDNIWFKVKAFAWFAQQLQPSPEISRICLVYRMKDIYDMPFLVPSQNCTWMFTEGIKTKGQVKEKQWARIF